MLTGFVLIIIGLVLFAVSCLLGYYIYDSLQVYQSFKSYTPAQEFKDLYRQVQKERRQKYNQTQW